jgi:hypothetical protein
MRWIQRSHFSYREAGFFMNGSWQDHTDSRTQGAKGLSEMLKNYKELKVWKKDNPFLDLKNSIKTGLMII